MTFRVAVLPQAKEDIARNSLWWADNHSVDQAIIWAETVEQQLLELEHNPEAFSFANEHERFPYQLRQMLLGLGRRRSYRAVFTIKNEDVYVLTIRRAAQDVIGPDKLPRTIT